MKRPLRLIVEGHDGAAKTSMCKALSNELNVPVYKCSKDRTKSHFLDKNKNTKLNILQWGIPEQLDLIKQCNVSVIYDRFFPSEWVYAHVLGRKTDDALVFEYDKLWNELGGKILFLYKDIVEDEDELIPASKFNDIKNKYIEYSKLTHCRHLFLNTTVSNKDYDTQLSVQLASVYNFLF